uniref:Tumor necrosis factor receptor type 1-associated DEATH domain protein isoform X2 n=1 Tax=Geotrypetes seraphini TaxID=260995 RepID=A0A6P8QMY0_GEOSA|nr:tumor necrosis factor receptor type 1-associated DEATH domain protein isoform X2 [Geotrypetes seraphini]
MAESAGMWTGSAYLFVESTSEKIDLDSLYNDSQQKLKIFRALKLALEDSTVGSTYPVDILKVYCSKPQLIVYIKFCHQDPCRRFLQSYRNGVLHQSLQNQLQIVLSMLRVPVKLVLKVGSEQLDNILDDEDGCLKYINKEKPDRIKDEEIKKLEEHLKNLSFENKRSNGTAAGENNSLPLHSQRNLLPQEDIFLFHTQEFGCAQHAAEGIAQEVVQDMCLQAAREAETEAEQEVEGYSASEESLSPEDVVEVSDVEDEAQVVEVEAQVVAEVDQQHVVEEQGAWEVPDVYADMPPS